jgi:hypothetical protein
MNTRPMEPLYEALRAWALHPTAVRPAGWAQILGGGLAQWMQAVQRLPAVSGSQTTTLHTPRPRPGELPRLLAGMIAEVYP